MCIGMVNNISWFLSLTIFVALVLNLSDLVGCQDDGQELYKPGNSSATRLLARLAFSGIRNLSAFAGPEVLNSLKFCINDVDAEWNAAFNFSSNLEFVDRCVQTTKGDLLRRLCTVAEIKFYLSSFTSKTAASDTSKSANFLKPNNNCNLTFWGSGCEPGWSCALPKGQKIDLKNSKIVPVRNLNCQPCCEGFFCPHGITCMIPCPLGAYCPLAKFNETSGVCDPYHYQLPPRSNHSCGGADIWADIARSTELFCSAGSYCPSTIQKIPCRSGHYCRTGSTSQTRCFRLVACESKTEKQNITAFGILLFAGLILLLLIIYNCSDQVLTTRERRQAKSRESGARSARENAEANERWTSAKETARKMQSQISRTFSRKRSERQLGQAIPGTDAASLPMPTGASQPKAKKRGGSNLTQMMQEIEENPDSHEGFNMEIGDKNLKKNKPKQMQTRTQIFKYAYGQIEKEKAMQEKNKDLTYSGIISMGSDIEVRTRPTIEVAFKDLTLTLKSNGKHIMRCVTGKIVPGHVSAVMGPSGAGKTTFLSALAGKIKGCTMSGMILINGKNESIHSYKKIIGFVPQDDIVHGNLTVEENLWFSARCRLSAHLPKPEKVLVVERVIESLGLQHVRDSLVGTVEKRGISGGQKKRVNVGLEMVMEPSLLILDEPTSGLDSSSSLLLLRALRREALEGVNICMVLHQPSYTLYKMFDDLVLLAKGGLTVYHGSVRKVEEYFAGMGIHVPDRINPPDYFIDILEGIVKLSSGVNYKDFPLRWLLHNGYRVPPDMLNSAGLSASATDENSVHETNSVASGSDEQSFTGDLLKDAKSNVEVEKDNIHNNFLKSMDLSNRVTPGVLQQYKYFLGRVGRQRLRESRIQAADFLILLIAGICLGTLAKVSDESFGALGYTYTIIAVSLLVMIAALRSFSLDKLHYWRESASGTSSLAYFLSKDTIDHFNTIIKPVVYLSMFYFFNNPRSSFLDHYIVLVCMVYFVTGMAYILAIYLEPGPAQLWSVLLPVVFSLIAHQNEGEGIMGKIENLCYSKWTMEAFVIANAQRYSGVWLITRCGALLKSHYHLDDWIYCLGNLIIAGVACRIAAYLCLIIFQKK